MTMIKLKKIHDINGICCNAMEIMMIWVKTIIMRGLNFHNIDCYEEDDDLVDADDNGNDEGDDVVDDDNNDNADGPPEGS